MPGTECFLGTGRRAEDLLLLLVQLDSGTIAGENFFYVLGGAVLADLSLGEFQAAKDLTLRVEQGER